MNVFTLWSAKRSTQALDGLQSSRLNPGANNLILGGDGNPYDTIAALMSQRPTLSMETVHVDQWLDYIGVTCLKLNGTNFVGYFAEADADGTRDANGLALTVAQGLLVPRTLSAQQDGRATLAVDLIMRSSDGSTAPYTIQAEQTLTAAASVDEWFTLGPITVNAVDVGDVTSFTLDFGVEVGVIQGDGDLYPTALYVRGVRPRLSFDCFTAQNHATWGIGGTSNVVVAKLLKGANGGRAGSGDITITTSASRVIVSELGASHNGEAMLRVEAVAISASGTAHPIAIT